MNILIVSCVFYPEPLVSAQISFDLANELSNRDDIVVLSPKPTRPFGKVYENENNNFSFKHIQLDSFTSPQSKILSRFRESYSFGNEVKIYIKNNSKNIDVVYLNSWPLFSQYKIVRIANKYKIPTVTHIQDIYPESLIEKLPNLIGKVIYTILLPFDILILKQSTKIVTISSKMKEYIEETRGIDKSKISVVRNWQDDNLFLNTSNISVDSDKFIFMYLGSINPSANVELLIEAFGRANLYNSRLVIFGSGPNKESCVSLSEKFSKADISFENVTREEVAIKQSEADVLLLPLKKGMGKTASPSKFTAYTLSGKPVLASIDEDSETANLIIENNCGFVVSPDNIDALSKKMIEVSLLSSKEIKTLGNNSINVAKKYLTKDVNLNRLISEIKNSY